MFGLTLSALEYPVMKCCFTASSRACPALDASIAPGAAAGTKGSVCPPLRSGRISLIFWNLTNILEYHLYFGLEGLRTCFSTVEKKIKVVFFLLIIFSTSRAKTSPRGVGWTELWLLLLRDAQRGVTGLSVGWEWGFLLPMCSELCTNPRSCPGDPKEGVYTEQQA